jgi:hypothetical protein
MHTGHRPVGWRVLHVAIDMVGRLVFTEFRPTSAAPTPPRSSIGRWRFFRASLAQIPRAIFGPTPSA